MKFRVFTNAANGRKVAVNIDSVKYIEVADENAKTTYIFIDSLTLAYDDAPDSQMVPVVIEVEEDFDVVFSRLNTIAE